VTLLTFNSKIVVQSSTAVTTTSSTLSDDTQASPTTHSELTFTLSATQTVLAIYVANSNHGSTNNYKGFQNAINVDGTDVALMNDSPTNSNYAIRNSCIWVGSLNAGSHTIKGRLSSINNGFTITINNRTLLIYIFNGDSFYYVDNTTSQASSSTTYIDDSYAATTFTPSENCVALSLYAATNVHGATEAASGKKICLNVAGNDYTIYESGKSPDGSAYADSATTIYATALSNVSTTIKGRYASASSGTVTVSRSVFAVLLFDPSTVLDPTGSTAQASTSSTSLVTDPNISITRSTSGELLLLASSYKKQGSAASQYGLAYGLNLDSANIVVSRSCPEGQSYCESVFVAYGTTIAAGSHTINGCYAVNYSTTIIKIDERILIALWFPTGQEMLTKSFSSSNDIALSKPFYSSNDLRLSTSFASSNDIAVSKLFNNSNDINLSKVFSSSNDILLSNLFSSSNDIISLFIKLFSSSNDILLSKSFSANNDIDTSKTFSSTNNLLLSKPFLSSNDLLLSKGFTSNNDIDLNKPFQNISDIQLVKSFSSSNNIKIYKLFQSDNDIKLIKIFSSTNAILLTELLTKLFSSSNNILINKPFSSSTDIHISKTFNSYNDINLNKLFQNSNNILIIKLASSSNDILLNTVFSSSNDIIAFLTKVFDSSNDIQASKIFESSNDILISKLFSSTNSIIFTITGFKSPLTLIIDQKTRTVIILQPERKLELSQAIRTVTLTQ
jgi:hypothetical protein